ncbi:hypothetical protein TTRE_0000416001 [Trichuris trichiura]|uniref:Uncharacterized protein n=1 Tax=Trichuris trichiura TaxID=36087 RepID=A0A077Z6R8_TRITR|nr:hypothetical protein TTRE_0000416001 [Trichuris trichiura]
MAPYIQDQIVPNSISILLRSQYLESRSRFAIRRTQVEPLGKVQASKSLLLFGLGEPLGSVHLAPHGVTQHFWFSTQFQSE